MVKIGMPPTQPSKKFCMMPIALHTHLPNTQCQEARPTCIGGCETLGSLVECSPWYIQGTAKKAIVLTTYVPLYHCVTNETLFKGPEFRQVTKEPRGVVAQ